MVAKCLEQLRLLIGKGFYVFPIVPDGKEAWPGMSWPAVSSLQLEYVEAWLAKHPDSNWGIDAGKSGLLIVDVDTKQGKQGAASFEELDLVHGMPPTFTVKTPSGGFHHYYQGSSRNRIGMMPGIDIRAAGGYVVAPGSTIAGVPYEIISDIKPKTAPGWLVSMVGVPKAADSNRDTLPCLVDEARAHENAVEYATLAEPAIEGLGGDTRTFVVACQLRDLGVSQEACLDILLQHWNPRCEPPWDERDLERKVIHAYRYAKDRPGNESPEAKNLEATQIFDSPVSSVARPAVTLRKYDDIGLRSLPREWVVEDWIPLGPAAFTLFTGDGGTGKSIVSIDLGLAVAGGDTWHGIQTTQMPVLYISCEDDEDEIDRRVYAHRTFPGREGRMASDRPFYVESRTGKNSLLSMCRDGVTTKGPFYGELDALLSQIPGDRKLLILDTLVDMFGGNENSRPEVNMFVKTVIGSLALKHNATVILIAHPPKSTGATYSGSTAWNGAVRNRLYLRNHDPKRKTKYRVLSNEKANYGAAGGEIILKWDHGIYTAVDTSEMEGLLESAIYEEVQTAEDTGNVLSMAPQSAQFIGRRKIVDAEGNIVSSEDLMRLVNGMIARGVLKNVSGKSRGNGLFIS